VGNELHRNDGERPPQVSRIPLAGSEITMKSMTVRGALVLALGAGACWPASTGGPELIAQAPRVDTFRVVKTYPHDPAAYTQGLLYRDGFLFESTGLNGQSTLRKVKLETGEAQFAVNSIALISEERKIGSSPSRRRAEWRLSDTAAGEGRLM
jgi:hypothetical protein